MSYLKTRDVIPPSPPRESALTLTGTPSSKPGSLTAAQEDDEKKGQENDDLGRTVTTTSIAADGSIPDGVLTGARLYLVFLALMFSVFVSIAPLCPGPVVPHATTIHIPPTDTSSRPRVPADAPNDTTH